MQDDPIVSAAVQNAAAGRSTPPGSGPAIYRVYVADPLSPAEEATVIAAESDSEAIWRVCALPNFIGTAEVWQGMRLIARLTSAERSLLK